MAKLILKVAVSDNNTLFWYLNQQFIGTTKDIHEMAISPKPGKYTVTVTDVFGNEIRCFIVVEE